MKLIPNWKQAHKFWSMKLNALKLGAVGAWFGLPAEWKSAVPPLWLGCAAAAVVALGMVLQLLDQELPDQKDEPKP